MTRQNQAEWTGSDAGLAVILGWLIPGLGHLYLGRRRKALILFVLIMITYMGGQALAQFECVFYRTTPMLKSRLWFYGQAGVGLPTALFSLATKAKDERTESEMRYQMRPGFEIGTLLTTVAGLLNLLAVVDCYDIYYRRKHPQPDEVKDAKAA